MHRVISPPNLDQRSMGDRIQHSGITFTAADMPNANRLTVGIMAMAAEEERRAVCERTRAALAAARRGGVRLGGPVENLKNAELGRQKAAEAREANRHPAPPTSCR